MGQIERIYKIERLLAARQSTPREVLLEELGVSLATFKRDLEYMRDRFNAPIIWDADLRGYRFNESTALGPKFHLPGVWFSEQELLAFATMQYLLASIAKDGPIARQLEPLMERLAKIIGQENSEVAEIRKRVKLLSTTTRRDDLTYFKSVGSALVKRRRIEIAYESRGSSKESSTRVVSPQRLIHYRNNWYLGAWCHKAEGIRTFSLDAISDCEVLEKAAKAISESKLAEYYDGGYGIFGGEEKKHWAKLRFNPQAARYVAGEIWHADQRGRMDKHGHYILEVPYASSGELLMDVLRHGAEVEVLGPQTLRDEVRERVREMSELYSR